MLGTPGEASGIGDCPRVGREGVFRPRAKEFRRTQIYIIKHHQQYQPFFQLTRMTRDKGALAKDDRLDALAMAIAYWPKALAVETEKVVQKKRDEMMQAELERYMAHAIGHKPKGRMYATTMHNR
jgi:hypothetical protein